MNDWKIPLYKIYFDDDDVNAVSSVIKRGMNWTGGPSVPAFEKEIAQAVHRQYSVAFNSGTSGQLAILQALHIGKGDSVIVPSFTFISTCNTVIHAGATPIFADIEDQSYGLDPADIESKITKTTKAIVPVHYAGASCQIDEIKKIASDNDILMIEDAAEALGTLYKGKPVGSSGIAAMFSFCGNKVVTTGEGGMVVTDDDVVMETLGLLRSHGRTDQGGYFTSSESFDYIGLGHNWRMSDVTAELGRSQLKKLPLLIKKRQEVARIYEDLLSNEPVVYPKPLSDSTHIFQMYTVRFQDKAIREAIRKRLTERKIMTKIYFNPVHLTSFYSSLGFGKISLPITEHVADTVLTLPMYPNMPQDDVELVCESIRDGLK
jgi:perosamine synthetase